MTKIPGQFGRAPTLKNQDDLSGSGQDSMSSWRALEDIGPIRQPFVSGGTRRVAPGADAISIVIVPGNYSRISLLRVSSERASARRRDCLSAEKPKRHEPATRSAQRRCTPLIVPTNSLSAVWKEKRRAPCNFLLMSCHATMHIVARPSATVIYKR